MKPSEWLGLWVSTLALTALVGGWVTASVLILGNIPGAIVGFVGPMCALMAWTWRTDVKR